LNVKSGGGELITQLPIIKKKRPSTPDKKKPVPLAAPVDSNKAEKILSSTPKSEILELKRSAAPPKSAESTKKSVTIQLPPEPEPLSSEKNTNNGPYPTSAGAGEQKAAEKPKEPSTTDEATIMIAPDIYKAVGTVNKVAERLFNTSITRPKSAVDKLSYAERLQVMIMQVQDSEESSGGAPPTAAS